MKIGFSKTKAGRTMDRCKTFKSNTKGLCVSEYWPEKINYHYISCKRDSQANRLKDGYTYPITIGEN